jgi:hypothetical protein
MSDIDVLDASVNREAEVSTSEFLWCAAEIGAVIGRSARQAFHILAAGQIKSARRIGGRWMVNRAALLRELGAA